MALRLLCTPESGNLSSWSLNITFFSWISDFPSFFLITKKLNGAGRTCLEPKFIKHSE